MRTPHQREIFIQLWLINNGVLTSVCQLSRNLSYCTITEYADDLSWDECTILGQMNVLILAEVTMPKDEMRNYYV